MVDERSREEMGRSATCLPPLRQATKRTPASHVAEPRLRASDRRSPFCFRTNNLFCFRRASPAIRRSSTHPIQCGTKTRVPLYSIRFAPPHNYSRVHNRAASHQSSITKPTGHAYLTQISTPIGASLPHLYIIRYTLPLQTDFSAFRSGPQSARFAFPPRRHSLCRTRAIHALKINPKISSTNRLSDTQSISRALMTSNGFETLIRPIFNEPQRLPHDNTRSRTLRTPHQTSPT